MWVTVLTAAISAVAVLAGVIVNNKMTLARTHLEFKEKEKQADRSEYLRLASELTGKAWAVRHVAMKSLRQLKPPNDVQQLLNDQAEVESLASRVRLLATKFDTVHSALQYSATLREIVMVINTDEPVISEASGVQLTLLSASAKMQEVALVNDFRDECGLRAPEGEPKFDFNRDMRSFLGSVFADDERVEEILGQMRGLPDKRTKYWRL